MARTRVLVETVRKAAAMTLVGAVAFTILPPLLSGSGGAAFARGGIGGASGTAGGHSEASTAATRHAGGIASGAAGEARGMAVPAAPDRAALSSALVSVNAAWVSPRTREGAASTPGGARLASYEEAMLTALTRPQGPGRDHAIARARAQELDTVANRPVTWAVVRRVDSLLGLPAADPTLGVGR